MHDGVAVQQLHVSIERGVEYVRLAEHVGGGGGLQVDTEVSEIEHGQRTAPRSCEERKGGGGGGLQGSRETAAALVSAQSLKNEETCGITLPPRITPRPSVAAIIGTTIVLTCTFLR
jgi:hypothetical protein